MEIIHEPNSDLLICKTPSDESQYEVYQVNGQKFVKFLAQDGAFFRPEPNSEIFACNLPRDIDVLEVFKFFARAGEIFLIRLLMDFSGFNRGKCFVQYKTVKASREAVCCLHDEIIVRDFNVVVKLSLNNSQLILKSIPVSMGEDLIKEALFDVIGEGLKRVALRSTRDPLNNVCYCKFQNHQFAVMAHKKIWPYLRIFGAVVEVHWAVPDLMRKSAHLYFRNYPKTITKKEFFEIIIEKIDVKALVLIRMDPVLNCGLITFMSPKNLKYALTVLQDLDIQGFRLEISVTPFVGNANDDHKAQRFSSVAARGRYQGNKENFEAVKPKMMFRRPRENNLNPAPRSANAALNQRPILQPQQPRCFGDITNCAFIK